MNIIILILQKIILLHLQHLVVKEVEIIGYNNL